MLPVHLHILTYMPASTSRKSNYKHTHYIAERKTLDVKSYKIALYGCLAFQQGLASRSDCLELADKAYQFSMQGIPLE